MIKAANPKRFNLSALQMVSVAEPEQNIATIERLLSDLEPIPNQLVLLPENALSFANKAAYLTLAEQIGEGVLQSQLACLAARYQCYLVCGSFPIRPEQSQPQQSGIYTTSLVFSPQGRLISHYHKIHLFDALVSDAKGLYKESDTFLAGQDLQLFDWKNGNKSVKVGLAICYDLRFPSLFQALRDNGAEVILVPAAFTQPTGYAHWLPLLQARAIENQCYVVAANQGGTHPCGRQTYGHSMIISPWGKVLTECYSGDAFIVSEFEKKLIDEIRMAMPVSQHNRFITTLISES
ncbi:carbon-nitrogen hydrolase family protein [Psychromonas sp. MME2]|uniref:carbon-nitrogen hydrolase family protein n=1 Tax=unclassified Psychromonas TaxID=2614957 RepID=UPI00339D1B49